MATSTVRELFVLTEKMGFSLHVSEWIYSLLPEDARPSHINVHKSDREVLLEGDVTVAIGGDGTILRAADLVRAVKHPLLAINSGRLGFLANIQRQSMEPALRAILSGSYELDKRNFIEAEFSNGNVRYALNEFVFSRKGSVSMITLTAEYDGAFINQYWSDGIIVSSPTGSTAYNLSAGGPIVLPQTDVIVLTPINPHTLTTRALILPSKKNLTVRVEPIDQEVLFSSDGNNKEVPDQLSPVNIRQSDQYIQLIKFTGQSYFETLRNKLMWGADIREKR